LGRRSGRRYSYAEVADRVEAVLGVRPQLSTLRAAAAADARVRGTNSRVRVTAGMPAPIKQVPGYPTEFDANAIEHWLANHPRAQGTQQMQLLANASPKQRDKAVARARAAGLSWQQIADAIGQAEGKTYSRQWAQQRYGPRTK
jgi:hypothetical protein